MHTYRARQATGQISIASACRCSRARERERAGESSLTWYFSMMPLRSSSNLPRVRFSRVLIRLPSESYSGAGEGDLRIDNSNGGGMPRSAERCSSGEPTAQTRAGMRRTHRWPGSSAPTPQSASASLRWISSSRSFSCTCSVIPGSVSSQRDFFFFASPCAPRPPT